MYTLVELNIFEEITFVFLHVGHTGFAPDQMFSCLAQTFRKNNIKTVEDLVWLIEKSPIHPPPSVKFLDYIFDWKGHISPQMAAKLKNHSIPKAFMFTKESSETKMRYKSLPQSLEWIPKTGIKLLKDDADFGPVGIAPFRVESLEIDDLEASLRTKYFPTLQAQVRIHVETSWQRLRRKLEGLERMKECFPKMDLRNLPVTGNQPKDVFEFDEAAGTSKDVEGEIYPESHGDLKIGDDVAVYTKEKKGRPWVGRVLDIVETEVLIHWFSKNKRKYTYEELKNNDGSLQTDRISRDTIMYHGISSVSKEKSFMITPTFMNKILLEYDVMDEKIV